MQAEEEEEEDLDGLGGWGQEIKQVVAPIQGYLTCERVCLLCLGPSGDLSEGGCYTSSP